MQYFTVDRLISTTDGCSILLFLLPPLTSKPCTVHNVRPCIIVWCDSCVGPGASQASSTQDCHMSTASRRQEAVAYEDKLTLHGLTNLLYSSHCITISAAVLPKHRFRSYTLRCDCTYTHFTLYSLRSHHCMCPVFWSAAAHCRY